LQQLRGVVTGLMWCCAARLGGLRQWGLAKWAAATSLPQCKRMRTLHQHTQLQRHQWGGTRWFGAVIQHYRTLYWSCGQSESPVLSDVAFSVPPGCWQRRDSFVVRPMHKAPHVQKPPFKMVLPRNQPALELFPRTFGAHVDTVGATWLKLFGPLSRVCMAC
jgi:hypothetical protein